MNSELLFEALGEVAAEDILRARPHKPEHVEALHSSTVPSRAQIFPSRSTMRDLA